ncbi:MmgE/PrpD family protein [Rhizomonospora bruguierae]|uniref:MmgE/PrpD family protein n=1 Tax=Rhizomonospora bruguierae TaxID=1581705 RepID=UPI001BCB714A|nr:MmgE/PrpD family protein [Micromonospora sp. NBRC 107566]
MTDSLTEKVARFAIDTKPGDIDDELRKLAIRPIIDTIGVIAAGSSGPAGSTILHYGTDAAMPGSTAGLTWYGAPQDAPPETKALIASTLAHGLDYDDEMSGVGHPSAMTLTALLALPRSEPLAGTQLLEAYVIGFEVIAKVARSIGPKHYKLGWHTTLTGGGFGAAMAASRLLGLDMATARIALGIVATLAGGLQRNFGTMTKPLHSGLAARNGVMAAQLAAVGFTANDMILDGPKGFLDIYGAGASRPEAIDTLGSPWALQKPGVSLKKYPCCYATHRVIDSILAIQAEHDVSPDDLAKIEIVAPTDATIPLIHKDPRTGLQGKFSMQYVSSAAFLDRKVTLDSFSDENVSRPGVRAIMSKVDVREDPKNRPEDPTAANSSSGTGGFFDVTVHTRSGQSYHQQRHYPTGSPKHPLSWEDSQAKFRDCLRAGGRDEVAGMMVFDELAEIERVPDVHALLARLGTGR